MGASHSQENYDHGKKFFETSEAVCQPVRCEINESWRRRLAPKLDPEAAKCLTLFSSKRILERKPVLFLFNRSSLPFLKEFNYHPEKKAHSYIPPTKTIERQGKIVGRVLPLKSDSLLTS